MAVLLALLAALVLAPAAHAAFPAENGKIAFEDGSDIWVMDAAGTGRTNLTNSAATDFDPAWSPDGRRIAFASNRNLTASAMEIWVMDADGSNARRVTFDNVQLNAYPAWSPDGQRIVFSQNLSSIELVNADGTGRKQITPNLLDWYPAWSPDGSRILFLRDECEDPGCEGYTTFQWIMNADGSGQAKLTIPGIAATWSPEGSKITSVGPGTNGDVHISNVDGSGDLNVSNDSTANQSPVWAPDGSKILFGGFELGGFGDLYTVGIDGSGRTNLTNTPGAEETNPDWQPIPYQSTPAPTYDHPRLASPVNVSLVPNFRQTISNSQCTSRGGLNSNHGPPLAFASCNPPGFVPGTIAHMGPASSSFASYAVIHGDTNAANGDQANMTLRASMNDIRTAGGADYTPSLTLVTKLRITDRFNGGSQTDPATVSDFETFTPIACAATAGPNGANCNLDSSLDAQTPGAIKENKGTVVQVFRFRINDSGANGTRGDGDDRTFAVQGIYIP